ncbi:hypothetical protein [Bacillus sp. OAE603]|uniref:hypothetical protein n=1 Tax=Gottfriedia sp. OAE603 TaxID=2663872 RepID=UPI00178B9A32
MDKSSKISIKINGEEKEYEEDVVNPHEKVEEKTEFQWVLPTPDGLGKKVIVLDDVKKKKNEKKKPKMKKEKRKIPFFLNNSSYKSIIISIISASLIGLCFGFVFLSIFKQSKSEQQSPDVVTVAPTQVQMNIPAISFDLAQVGMFKNMDSAQKNVDEIAEQGYEAVIYEKNEAFFVVIALSGKESTFLKDEVKKKLDSVYLKEESIGGGEYTGPKQSVEMYKAEIETFAFILSYLSSNNFNNEKQLEQINSTLLILNNQKDLIKNQQLLTGLKHLQNIEKELSNSEGQSLNQVTQNVQKDVLGLFKLLKEQKNTLTN